MFSKKKQIRHIKENPGIRLFKQVAYVSIYIYLIYIYIHTEYNIYIYMDLGQVVQDLLGSSYQGMVATVCPIRDYDIPQINLPT